MLNGAPLCDIKKRDKILKKFMMVKIAAYRHIHFRLCRRADGRREISMKKTNKIIGGIVVTSLAASIIGGCYKFEAEKNVVPSLYASPPPNIIEERERKAQKTQEREEPEKQQEQERKQQEQPKTETKK